MEIEKREILELEPITEMVTLQKELNDDTNGINWELGKNKFGKDINWLRCINMELAELIDSTPWKHWKNISAQPDLQNIKVELVDIWHFLMSLLLQESNIPKAIEIAQFGYARKDLRGVFSTMGSSRHGQNSGEFDYKKLIIACEVLQLETLKMSIEHKQYIQREDLVNLVKKFFICADIAELNIDELHKLYIGKNCLNKFRQDNGYKDGTYTKIWNQQEDNVVMVNLIESMEEVTFDKLYFELDGYYKTLDVSK